MHKMSGGSFRRVVSSRRYAVVRLVPRTRRTSSSNSHFSNIAVTGLGQRSVMMQMNRTQQTSRACLLGFGSGGKVQNHWWMWHLLERSQRLVMMVGQRIGKALLLGRVRQH